MNAGSIDGMHGSYSGQNRRNDRAGEFMDELAEDRILLRRTTDDGDRPDRAVAMIHVLDAKHRKIVLQDCSSPDDRQTDLRAAACSG